MFQGARRGPKSAVPTLTWVAPSSTATAKSSLMPIESQPGKPCHSGRAARSSRSARSWRNQGREASGSSPGGGIAIRPAMRRWARPARGRTAAASPAGEKPCLLSSPPRLISRKPSRVRPRSAASRSRASAMRGRSMEWTARNSSTAGRILLVWRGPIRCHSTSRTWAGSSRHLATASCTRFSPKTRRPASQAAASAAGAWVLLAPTRTTLPAGRPLRLQASPMRSRIQARRSAMDASPFTASARLRRLQVEDALAGLALDQAAAVADLHHHLRPDAVVAGGAVPLPLLLARPLDDPHRRHRSRGVALQDALELRDDVAGKLLPQAGEPALELLHLPGDPGLFGLPARLLGRVALLDLAEALAQRLQLLLRLLGTVQRGEGLLFAGGDLPLDGVDLLLQRAVLALRAHLVDLLLVFLEFFLGILHGGFGGPAVSGRLRRGSFEGFDLGFSGFVLFVQLAHPVGDPVEPLFGIPELAEGLLQLQDGLEVLTHLECSLLSKENHLTASCGRRPRSPASSMARSAPKWVHLGSNQGPSGYEPDALTAELWTRGALRFRAIRQYTIHGPRRRVSTRPEGTLSTSGPALGPARPSAGGPRPARSRTPDPPPSAPAPASARPARFFRSKGASTGRRRAAGRRSPPAARRGGRGRSRRCRGPSPPAGRDSTPAPAARSGIPRGADRRRPPGRTGSCRW